MNRQIPAEELNIGNLVTDLRPHVYLPSGGARVVAITPSHELGKDRPLFLKLSDSPRDVRRVPASAWVTVAVGR